MSSSVQQVAQSTTDPDIQNKLCAKLLSLLYSVAPTHKLSAYFCALRLGFGKNQEPVNADRIQILLERAKEKMPGQKAQLDAAILVADKIVGELNQERSLPCYEHETFKQARDELVSLGLLGFSYPPTGTKYLFLTDAGKLFVKEQLRGN